MCDNHGQQRTDQNLMCGLLWCKVLVISAYTEDGKSAYLDFLDFRFGHALKAESVTKDSETANVVL